jgi:hypothetical protein
MQMWKGVSGLTVCPAGLVVALDQSLLSACPFLPSGMGVFPLHLAYHCILKGCEIFFSFSFSQRLTIKFSLRLGGRFGLTLLNNAGIVKTLGLLGDEINVFLHCEVDMSLMNFWGLGIECYYLDECPSKFYVF